MSRAPKVSGRLQRRRQGRAAPRPTSTRPKPARAKTARAPQADRTLAAHGGQQLRQVISGLELFQRLASGELPPPPLVSLLGFKLVEAAQGRIVFTAEPKEEYYNGIGVVHGGWSAALLDSAMGCAVNSMMPAGKIFATLELKVNLTRPLHHHVGPLRCEATVLHVGSRSATAEGKIVDRLGKLYAHGTTTCLLVESHR